MCGIEMQWANVLLYNQISGQFDCGLFNGWATDRTVYGAKLVGYPMYGTRKMALRLRFL